MNVGGFELATLGGGCFWCLEPVFEDLQGINNVIVGYAGGSVDNPSYQEVGRGDTGHAEVVQITFDPNVISYNEILGVFFSVHDPTTPNRQGADVGPQYRSLILHHNPEQEAAAMAMIERLETEEVFQNSIVTEIEPYDAFYEAEEYHQDYYEKNPDAGYCIAVIAPKVQKFRKQYSERLKEQAPTPR
ncbi:MAG: peptide-methionine (S)-S-oxide reductase MsrA [Anaerolineales bacterium]